MAGVVRARNVPARSDRLCRADNYALCRLPRFIHQPLGAIVRKTGNSFNVLVYKVMDCS